MNGPIERCPWCRADVPPSNVSCSGCGRSIGERFPYGEALEAVLRSIDGVTARHAAYLLGKHEEWRAVPALARAVGEGDPLLAVEALAALAHIATLEAMVAVQAAAHHPSRPVRLAAERILSSEAEHRTVG